MHMHAHVHVHVHVPHVHVHVHVVWPPPPEKVPIPREGRREGLGLDRDGTLVRGCEGSGGERGGGSDAGEPHARATEGSAGGGKKENGGGGEAQNGGGGSGGDGGGGVNGGARTDGDEINGGEGRGCMAAADARSYVVP